jgi:Tfp pilus assembly protein PilE
VAGSEACAKCGKSFAVALPVVVTTRTSGFAIAGFVLAFFVGILGLIFSIIGYNEVKRSNGSVKGGGLAIAGIVISILTTIIMLLAAIAIPAFMDYMHKSKSIEAKLQLNKLSRLAKTLYIEKEAFPESSAPLTPATPCCAQPGHRCANLPDDWQAPEWRAFEFQADERGRFQYSFTSTKSTFDAIAIGDLDCNGSLTTYNLHMTIANGFPTSTITP